MAQLGREPGLQDEGSEGGGPERAAERRSRVGRWDSGPGAGGGGTRRVSLWRRLET